MPYTKRFKKTLYNPAWLREQYADKQRSSDDIAAELHTDSTAVLRRLKRYGIPVRSNSEAQKVSKVHRGSSTPRPRKNRDTLHNEAWLREHYLDKDLNASEIARLVGVAPHAVFWALKKFGIPSKGMSASKAGRRNPKRRVADEVASKSTMMKRANEALEAEGVEKICILCDSEIRVEPHHKNHRWRDNAPENLEYLCRRCHRHQHILEEKLALKILLEEYDYPISKLYAQARGLVVKSLGGEPAVTPAFVFLDL